MLTNIAILLTCHNRKSQSLSCLTALYNCDLPLGFSFDVYLTDDGSTDGTGNDIKQNFPKVNIIQGNGSLFWNRGMYVAWDVASKTNEYDFYLWLNDDTLLYRNAFMGVFENLNSDFNSIICGATISINTKIVTYSGRLKNKAEPIKPNGTFQECNIVNGNFVLVPKVVFNNIGNLDWKFRHAIGDFDYGLRAQEAGFKCYVAPQFIGTCEANPKLPNWCLSTTPLIKRFKSLYSPLGYAEPIPFFIYEKRHFGVLVAFKHFLSINLRALLPKLWK